MTRTAVALLVLVLMRPEGAAATPARLVVPTAPQSENAVREAERGVADLERAERDRRALREATPQSTRRPDLGYDIQSGIQQRNLRRALPR